MSIVPVMMPGSTAMSCRTDLTCGLPGPGQLAFRRVAISELLGNLNGVSAAMVCQQMPDPTAACHGEQPQFPVAGPSAEKPQHPLRVGTRQPLRARHPHALRFFAIARLSDLGLTVQAQAPRASATGDGTSDVE